VSGSGGMLVVPEHELIGATARALARIGDVSESKPGTVAEYADSVRPFIDAINRGHETLHRKAALERSEIGIEFDAIPSRSKVGRDNFGSASVLRDIAERRNV